GAKYNFEIVRNFAYALALMVQKRLPNLISLERSPKKREGKIYIDYLQNRIGQTTASVYSVRPVIGATVSTPLHWEEVNKDLNPKNYTIKTIPSRLEKIGDVWEGILKDKVDLK